MTDADITSRSLVFGLIAGFCSSTTFPPATHFGKIIIAMFLWGALAALGAYIYQKSHQKK